MNEIVELNKELNEHINILKGICNGHIDAPFNQNSLMTKLDELNTKTSDLIRIYNGDTTNLSNYSYRNLPENVGPYGHLQ